MRKNPPKNRAKKKDMEDSSIVIINHNNVNPIINFNQQKIILNPNPPNSPDSFLLWQKEMPVSDPITLIQMISTVGPTCTAE